MTHLRHPSSRNQRRLIKKMKDKFGTKDRDGHVNKLLTEEKEIIDELRQQGQKAIEGTDT